MQPAMKVMENRFYILPQDVAVGISIQLEMVRKSGEAHITNSDGEIPAMAVMQALVHIRAAAADLPTSNASILDAGESGGYVRVRGSFEDTDKFLRAVEECFAAQNASVVEVSELEKVSEVGAMEQTEFGELKLGTLHTYEEDDA